ncbi:MAG: hypothetical protein NDJ89_00760 [Oligoflexia bacterium]|nr:hypothetical protein [Oligoflexia bacterium]
MYFEDQGEASHLQSRPISAWHDFTRFLYANLRHQWHYRPALQTRLHEYRTRGGAHIPLVIRTPSQALGVLPILEENPTAQAIAAATSFLKKNPNGKLLFAHPGKKDWVMSRKIRVVPASALL